MCTEPEPILPKLFGGRITVIIYELEQLTMKIYSPLSRQTLDVFGCALVKIRKDKHPVLVKPGGKPLNFCLLRFYYLISGHIGLTFDTRILRYSAKTCNNQNVIQDHHGAVGNALFSRNPSRVAPGFTMTTPTELTVVCPLTPPATDCPVGRLKVVSM